LARPVFAKLGAVHGLLKTELPVAAGVCVVVGEVISGRVPTFPEAAFGFLVGFLLSGAAMMSNDVWDLEVDRVNHPERPLPSGRISVGEVWALVTLFSLCGFVAAGLLGLAPLALSIVIWVVGQLYNWRFKESGLPGNMMVSISVSSTFVLGGVAVGGLGAGIVWLFGAIAFLFDLAEEIGSGAMDMEGDRLRGSRSLAITKGKPFALRVSASIFAVVVALTTLPYILSWLGTIYIALVLILDAAIVYFVYKLLRSETPEQGRKELRKLYLTMMLFVIAFVASVFI
jgi:geranylgeranylglycerol-phosphate geranylgeranyltransferase